MQKKKIKFDPEKFIKASNEIEEIFGEKEIEQSLKAWKYLVKCKTLSHADICRVQRIITWNQTDLDESAKGRYRGELAINVYVGGEMKCPYDQVDKEIDSWLSDLPKMTPLMSHIRFEHIHPFTDGNGRTGRMLYWWYCLQRNATPYFYELRNREAYYRLFDEDRIEKLKKNKWGIDFGKDLWEITVKLKSGKLMRFTSIVKPTDEMMKKTVAATFDKERFDSIIKMRELK